MESQVGVHLFKNVGERFPFSVENKDSVSLLFGVGKTLENLESNILIDHLEEGGLFYDVGHDFRSSCLIADPLTIIADGIARTFNIFAVAQIV